VPYPTKMLTRPPNDMRISCGRSCSRPHKLPFNSVLWTLRPGGARDPSGPAAACAG